MNMQNDQKPTVDQLLADYAKKNVKRFYQIDGTNEPFESDSEGCTMFGGGWQYELRNTGSNSMPVRITFHEDAKREDVIAVLRSAADWLERDWYALTVPEFGERVLQGFIDHMKSSGMMDDLEQRAADNDLLRHDEDDETPNNVDDIPF